jgi:hypothetical protein
VVNEDCTAAVDAVSVGATPVRWLTRFMFLHFQEGRPTEKQRKSRVRAQMMFPKLILAL